MNDLEEPRLEKWSSAYRHFTGKKAAGGGGWESFTGEVGDWNVNEGDP